MGRLIKEPKLLADNTWKEKLCTECVAESGHCPMRFYNGTQDKPSIHDDADVCLCHNDYNHCIASNENGEIPEIQPSADLERLDFTKSFVEASRSAAGITTTTTTTQAPEVRQALGFEVRSISALPILALYLLPPLRAQT